MKVPIYGKIKMFQTTNQMIVPKNNGIKPTHTGN
jgi:hypothetical protein